MQIFHDLTQWTLDLATTPHGLVGLFLIALAESSFFPIPPDLLQIAMSVLNPKMAYLYASVALIGSIIGAMIGYWIGFYGGRPLLKKILSENKISQIEHYYNKYDAWAIGIAGFTPIPYKLFTISGGAFKIEFWRFVLVSIISRAGRFFLVATGLFFFGEAAKDVILKNVNLVGILFIVLVILGFLASFLLGKKKIKQ